MVKVLRERVKTNKTSQIDDHFAYSFGKVLLVIYLAILSIFYVTYNIFPGPEYVVLCFLIYAAYKKWTRRFIKDWFPFIALFLAYQAMYGFADNISRVVHVNELINAELQIFGTIPTLVLQQFYRNPVFDYFGAFFLLFALSGSYAIWIHIMEVFSRKLQEIYCGFSVVHL